MTNNLDKLDYPYGEFDSYQELEIKIDERRRLNVNDLRGSAIIWNDEKPISKRTGVLVLSDGQICFSHAENI